MLRRRGVTHESSSSSSVTAATVTCLRHTGCGSVVPAHYRREVPDLLFQRLYLRGSELLTMLLVCLLQVPCAFFFLSALLLFCCCCSCCCLAVVVATAAVVVPFLYDHHLPLRAVPAAPPPLLSGTPAAGPSYSAPHGHRPN